MLLFFHSPILLYQSSSISNSRCCYRWGPRGGMTWIYPDTQTYTQHTTHIQMHTHTHTHTCTHTWLVSRPLGTVTIRRREGVSPWVPSQSGGGRGSATECHHNLEEGGGQPLVAITIGSREGVSPWAQSMREGVSSWALSALRHHQWSASHSEVR